MIELDYFFGLKDRDLRREGFGIAEGHTLVGRMLDSELDPLCLLCSDGQEDLYSELARGRCPVIHKSQREISSTIGFKFHRGVLGAFRRPQIASLMDIPHLPRLMVSLHLLQEESNIGAVIRSARAFGIRDFIITEGGGSDPYGRKSLRASAGWLFGSRLYRAEGGCEAIADLKSRFPKQHSPIILGAESGCEQGMLLKDYIQSSRPEHEILILGHEFEGLGKAELELCDRLLEIPMEERVDSLNVAVAAGIFLYNLSN